MAEVVRTAPLLRACLEVLRDADEPLSGKEAFERVERRVSLTSYERASFDDSGRARWENHLGWHTGDAATVGWMTKRDGWWSITESGVSALDAYDENALLAELRVRYNQIRHQRAQAVKTLSGVEEVIARALQVIPAGSWTSYDDLAELVDAPSEQVPHFLAGSKKAVPGGHRALYPDGRLPEDGKLHIDWRGRDLGRKLRSEGVEFDQLHVGEITERGHGSYVGHRRRPGPGDMSYFDSARSQAADALADGRTAASAPCARPVRGAWCRQVAGR